MSTFNLYLCITSRSVKNCAKIKYLILSYTIHLDFTQTQNQLGSMQKKYNFSKNQIVENAKRKSNFYRNLFNENCTQDFSIKYFISSCLYVDPPWLSGLRRRSLSQDYLSLTTKV